MRILAAGGGSGGHVTPVLAVLHELGRTNELETLFVTDRKFGPTARSMVAKSGLTATTQTIFSGKLRRYHGVSWGQQLRDIPTVLQNIRDVLLVGIGLVQSLWLMLQFRPQVVFTKGGFVCLPIGLAAAICRVPLVIHDSDAHPGLTNRVLARFATLIATGAPLENYRYPADRSHYVGIPVDGRVKPPTAEQQQHYKDQVGLPDTKRPLVMVTGGGLGAMRINEAMIQIADKLLDEAAVLHVTGTHGYEKIAEQVPQRGDYLVRPFIDQGMTEALAAADVVVTRAGATTMAELAALAKPVIIIPNPYLTAGHQLKNAQVYAEAQAAVVLPEEKLCDNPDLLLKAISTFLRRPATAQALGKAIHGFAHPHAARDTAALILQAAGLAQPAKKRGKR